MDNRDMLADLLLFANETASISGRELDTDEVNDFADFLDINDVVVQRWISVEERLPGYDDLVLCVGTKGGMFLGCKLRLFAGEKTAYCFVPNARQGRKATHWMPLPKPPKEET